MNLAAPQVFVRKPSKEQQEEMLRLKIENPGIVFCEEDFDRVESFWRSVPGKAYRRFPMYWYLEKNIKEFLTSLVFFKRMGGSEMEAFVKRTAIIIRSRMKQKKAATYSTRREHKKLKKLKEKEREELEHISPMLPGFEIKAVEEKKSKKKPRKGSPIRAKF